MRYTVPYYNARGRITYYIPFSKRNIQKKKEFTYIDFNRTNIIYYIYIYIYIYMILPIVVIVIMERAEKRK